MPREAAKALVEKDQVGLRGLHSLTSQLNFSAFFGIGVARWGCVAHVKAVSGGA